MKWKDRALRGSLVNKDKRLIQYITGWRKTLWTYSLRRYLDVRWCVMQDWALAPWGAANAARGFVLGIYFRQKR